MVFCFLRCHLEMVTFHSADDVWEIVDMFKMAGLTILSEKESPRNYNSPNGFMLIGQKKKS